MSLKYSIKFTKIGNKNNKTFFLKRILDKKKIIKKTEKKKEKTDRIIKDRKISVIWTYFSKGEDRTKEIREIKKNYQQNKLRDIRTLFEQEEEN